MGKKNIKTAPNIIDKRTDTKGKAIISNREFITDEDKIKEYKQAKQDALHNPLYAIDLNTDKIKKNTYIALIIDDKAILDNGLTDDLGKILLNHDLDQLNNFNKWLDKVIESLSAKKFKDADELDVDIYNFNNMYDATYLNGFSKRLRNLLDDEIKQEYANKCADASANYYLLGIKNVLDDIQDLVNIDISKLPKIKNYDYKDIKELVKNKSDDLTNLDLQIINILKDKLTKIELDSLDSIVSDNLDFYKKANDLYNQVDAKIKEVALKYYNLQKDFNNTKYDITKFKTNNDVVSKIDPIAKSILNGKNYEIGKLIKTTNNYNNKEYGAVFSIKTADLTNLDIIQELKQKGIKINHFGKKIIDDVDILLEENKGNVNNDDRLVALTPKMIAKKVYNVKQPTKKQQQAVEGYLQYLSNIYLFFVKDDATAVNVEQLVKLKDKGLEYLQDAEGNVLNIGDVLDDNIILNGKYGFSKKYNSIVYVFDNKSIFERVNQLINNDVGKQLLLSLKDKADEVFNDYNKNVNNNVVGIRCLLFERVNQLKHSIETNQKTNKEILLSNIYAEFDIDTPKQKQTARDIIKNVLDYWIDISYIVSYEFLDKNGNTIPSNSTKEIYKIYLNA